MLKGAGNLGGPLTQVLSRRNSVTITEGLGSLVAQSAHSPGLKPQLWVSSLSFPSSMSLLFSFYLNSSLVLTFLHFFKVGNR